MRGWVGLRCVRVGGIAVCAGGSDCGGCGWVGLRRRFSGECGGLRLLPDQHAWPDDLHDHPVRRGSHVCAGQQHHLSHFGRGAVCPFTPSLNRSSPCFAFPSLPFLFLVAIELSFLSLSLSAALSGLLDDDSSDDEAGHSDRHWDPRGGLCLKKGALEKAIWVGGRFLEARPPSFPPSLHL